MRRHPEEAELSMASATGAGSFLDTAGFEADPQGREVRRSGSRRHGCAVSALRRVGKVSMAAAAEAGGTVPVRHDDASRCGGVS